MGRNLPDFVEWRGKPESHHLRCGAFLGVVLAKLKHIDSRRLKVLFAQVELDCFSLQIPLMDLFVAHWIVHDLGYVFEEIRWG